MNLDISSASITDYSSIYNLFKYQLNTSLKCKIYNYLVNLYILFNINNNLLNTYIVKIDAKIVGAICFSIYKNNNILISQLIIDKEYRNKGIGSILLNKIKYKLLYKYNPANIYLYNKIYLDNIDRHNIFFERNEFKECREDENIIEKIFRKLNILKLYKFEEDAEYIKY